MKFTLAAVRKNAGLTQEQLAEKLGVVKSTVYLWENPDKPNAPDIFQARKIAEIVGVDLDLILF